MALRGAPLGRFRLSLHLGLLCAEFLWSQDAIIQHLLEFNQLDLPMFGTEFLLELPQLVLPLAFRGEVLADRVEVVEPDPQLRIHVHDSPHILRVYDAQIATAERPHRPCPDAAAVAALAADALDERSFAKEISSIN